MRNTVDTIMTDSRMRNGLMGKKFSPINMALCLAGYTIAIYKQVSSTMTTSTLFSNNRSQAVRLPAELRMPEGVKRVEIRARGMERIIAPAGHAWDSFFVGGDSATNDFMRERAEQVQSERHSL